MVSWAAKSKHRVERERDEGGSVFLYFAIIYIFFLRSAFFSGSLFTVYGTLLMYFIHLSCRGKEMVGMKLKVAIPKEEEQHGKVELVVVVVVVAMCAARGGRKADTPC